MKTYNPIGQCQIQMFQKFLKVKVNKQNQFKLSDDPARVKQFVMLSLRQKIKRIVTGNVLENMAF